MSDLLAMAAAEFDRDRVRVILSVGGQLCPTCHEPMTLIRGSDVIDQDGAAESSWTCGSSPQRCRVNMVTIYAEPEPDDEDEDDRRGREWALSQPEVGDAGRDEDDAP